MSDDPNWNRLVTDTMAAVDSADSALMEIWARIRASEEAVASSQALLRRLAEQEIRTGKGLTLR